MGARTKRAPARPSASGLKFLVVEHGAGTLGSFKDTIQALGGEAVMMNAGEAKTNITGAYIKAETEKPDIALFNYGWLKRETGADGVIHAMKVMKPDLTVFAVGSDASEFEEGRAHPLVSGDKALLDGVVMIPKDRSVASFRKLVGEIIERSGRQPA